MPRNKDSKPIDPTDMNRADSFSPGSSILVKVPGLDTPRRSGAASCRRYEPAPRPHEPLAGVVINAGRKGASDLGGARLERSEATGPPPDHPPGPELRGRSATSLRSATSTKRARRANRLQAVGGRRLRADVPRAPEAGGSPSVFLVWDFTVASERSLARSLLRIRDDAFGTLGDSNLKDMQVAGSSPGFTIDAVTDLHARGGRPYRPQGRGHAHRALLHHERLRAGRPLQSRRARLPRRMGTTQAKFCCSIPRSALDPASPPKARPSLYGHGLLGPTRSTPGT